MNAGRPPAPVEPSLTPDEGWHCSHLYYSLDRAALAALSDDQRRAACEQAMKCLDPSRDGAPQRLQTSVVSGHKADLGLMIMDPDPLVIDGLHQRLMGTSLGVALCPAYSFVSISEISEYVPSVQFSDEGQNPPP